MSRDQTPERPACWTDTVRDGPAWSYDHGRACENFGTRELAEKLLALIPGCSGCARAERAMQRWRGEEGGGGPR